LGLVVGRTQVVGRMFVFIGVRNVALAMSDAVWLAIVLLSRCSVGIVYCWVIRVVVFEIMAYRMRSAETRWVWMWMFVVFSIYSSRVFEGWWRWRCDRDGYLSTLFGTFLDDHEKSDNESCDLPTRYSANHELRHGCVRNCNGAILADG